MFFSVFCLLSAVGFATANEYAPLPNNDCFKKELGESCLIEEKEYKCGMNEPFIKICVSETQNPKLCEGLPAARICGAELNVACDPETRRPVSTEFDYCYVNGNTGKCDGSTCLLDLWPCEQERQFCFKSSKPGLCLANGECFAPDSGFKPTVLQAGSPATTDAVTQAPSTAPPKCVTTCADHRQCQCDERNGVCRNRDCFYFPSKFTPVASDVDACMLGAELAKGKLQRTSSDDDWSPENGVIEIQSSLPVVVVFANVRSRVPELRLKSAGACSEAHKTMIVDSVRFELMPNSTTAARVSIIDDDTVVAHGTGSAECSPLRNEAAHRLQEQKEECPWQEDERIECDKLMDKTTKRLIHASSPRTFRSTFPSGVFTETSSATRRAGGLSTLSFLCNSVSTLWSGADAAPLAQCEVYLELIIPEVSMQDCFQTTTTTLRASNRTTTNNSTTEEQWHSIAYECHRFQYGRPFVHAGEAVLAPMSAVDPNDAVVPASCDDESLLTAAADELTARVDVVDWQMQARNEHASVASFAKLALQLMAVGAPSPLLDATLRAGRDEVRHADLCLSMANNVHHNTASVTFDAFPSHAIDSIGVIALNELAVTTMREGCLGEMVSALRAVQSSNDAHAHGQPNIAELWRHIATDEARHALLAWRTVEWVRSRTTTLAQLDAQLQHALDDASESLGSDAVYDATFTRAIAPMFACVVGAPRDVDGQLRRAATNDRLLTDALDQLAPQHFNLDAVLPLMLNAIDCNLQ